MNSLYSALYKLGSISFDGFWFPVVIWTIVTTLVLFSLRLFTKTNPLYQYHIRVATIFALPIGFISTVIVQIIPNLIIDSSSFSSAVIVIENPIYEIHTYGNSIESAHLNWFNTNILIGGFTFLAIIGAFIPIGKLINSFLKLRNLRKSLHPTTLNDFNNSLIDTSVDIAFHDHQLVPFTFGWKNPIIVLPSFLKEDSARLNMAIKHELVHIRRGDYLVQLFISVISSLFWFHPIITITNNQIVQFREISCDQEVLNTSSIKPKEYAAMLLDLIPLQPGFGRFSVNMAVNQSTLKQRIETMKYHKLNKASYTRSFLLFLGIILIIVAPIACSDLQSPEVLSEEEILNEQLTLQNFTVSINGKDVMKTSGNGAVKAPGIGGLTISPENYGTFVLAIRPFEGAIDAGNIDGNTATFKVNELDVTVRSATPILKNHQKSNIWIKHDANHKLKSKFYAITDPTAKLPEIESITPVDDEIFIVVESMPQLIGGQSAIQSKIEYPEEAKRIGIEGRVTVQFIVNENGDVLNPKVIRGIGGGCDEEALRVVRDAKFEPGIQRGKKVRTQLSMPILFKLRNSE